ncbi:hypothetical protein HDU76_006962 [Blyttiomyces sp. JEL0837]|nr:hypothetical protein HDU76_006962 [Blyttiomyces sp. JEL0837]
MNPEHILDDLIQIKNAGNRAGTVSLSKSIRKWSTTISVSSSEVFYERVSKSNMLRSLSSTIDIITRARPRFAALQVPLEDALNPLVSEVFGGSYHLGLMMNPATPKRIHPSDAIPNEKPQLLHTPSVKLELPHQPDFKHSPMSSSRNSISTAARSWIAAADSLPCYDENTRPLPGKMKPRHAMELFTNRFFDDNIENMYQADENLRQRKARLGFALLAMFGGAAELTIYYDNWPTTFMKTLGTVMCDGIDLMFHIFITLPHPESFANSLWLLVIFGAPTLLGLGGLYAAVTTVPPIAINYIAVSSHNQGMWPLFYLNACTIYFTIAMASVTAETTREYNMKLAWTLWKDLESEKFVSGLHWKTLTPQLLLERLNANMLAKSASVLLTTKPNRGSLRSESVPSRTRKSTWSAWGPNHRVLTVFQSSIFEERYTAWNHQYVALYLRFTLTTSLCVCLFHTFFDPYATSTPPDTFCAPESLGPKVFSTRLSVILPIYVFAILLTFVNQAKERPKAFKGVMHAVMRPYRPGFTNIKLSTILMTQDSPPYLSLTCIKLCILPQLYALEPDIMIPVSTSVYPMVSQIVVALTATLYARLIEEEIWVMDSTAIKRIHPNDGVPNQEPQLQHVPSIKLELPKSPHDQIGRKYSLKSVTRTSSSTVARISKAEFNDLPCYDENLRALPGKLEPIYPMELLTNRFLDANIERLYQGDENLRHRKARLGFALIAIIGSAAELADGIELVYQVFITVPHPETWVNSVWLLALYGAPTLLGLGGLYTALTTLPPIILNYVVVSAHNQGMWPIFYLNSSTIYVTIAMAAFTAEATREYNMKLAWTLWKDLEDQKIVYGLHWKNLSPQQLLERLNSKMLSKLSTANSNPLYERKSTLSKPRTIDWSIMGPAPHVLTAFKNPVFEERYIKWNHPYVLMYLRFTLTTSMTANPPATFCASDSLGHKVFITRLSFIVPMYIMAIVSTFINWIKERPRVFKSVIVFFLFSVSGCYATVAAKFYQAQVLNNTRDEGFTSIFESYMYQIMYSAAALRLGVKYNATLAIGSVGWSFINYVVLQIPVSMSAFPMVSQLVVAFTATFYARLIEEESKRQFALAELWTFCRQQEAESTV